MRRQKRAWKRARTREENAHGQARKCLKSRRGAVMEDPRWNAVGRESVWWRRRHRWSWWKGCGEKPRGAVGDGTGNKLWREECGAHVRSGYPAEQRVSNGENESFFLFAHRSIFPTLVALRKISADLLDRFELFVRIIEIYLFMGGRIFLTFFGG